MCKTVAWFENSNIREGYRKQSLVVIFKAVCDLGPLYLQDHLLPYEWVLYDTCAVIEQDLTGMPSGQSRPCDSPLNEELPASGSPGGPLFLCFYKDTHNAPVPPSFRLSCACCLGGEEPLISFYIVECIFIVNYSLVL